MELLKSTLAALLDGSSGAGVGFASFVGRVLGNDRSDISSREFLSGKYISLGATFFVELGVGAATTLVTEGGLGGAATAAGVVGAVRDTVSFTASLGFISAGGLGSGSGLGLGGLFGFAETEKLAEDTDPSVPSEGPARDFGSCNAMQILGSIAKTK